MSDFYFKKLTRKDVEEKLQELYYHKATYRNFVGSEAIAEGYTIEAINDEIAYYKEIKWRLSS